MRFQKLFLATTALASIAHAGVIPRRGLLPNDLLQSGSSTQTQDDGAQQPAQPAVQPAAQPVAPDSDNVNTPSQQDALANTAQADSTGNNDVSSDGKGTSYPGTSDNSLYDHNKKNETDTSIQRKPGYHYNCENTPTSRQCWQGDHSCETDFHKSWPNTGRVRRYHLTVTNTTMAPDGFERIVFPINGQIPGPTIEADWGDILEITVTNHLKNNGTSIHWHGIRQLNSNLQDGVNGITECPLAPGYSKVYRFQCTQFGTSWYHSHHSGQYGDGVFGAIQINGPTSADYDEDLGTIIVNDWFWNTAAQVNLQAQQPGPPPTANNGLINGKMVSPDGSSGSYFRNKPIEKGKKYKLRLINASMNDHFQVGLDGHQWTVVAADFVACNPVAKDWVFLAVGQRHDVIFEANDPDGTGLYWLRAEPQQGCSANKNTGNIRSIIQYDGASDDDLPQSTATTMVNTCLDTTNIVPYVPISPDKSSFGRQVNDELTVAFAPGANQNNETVVFWTVNGIHTNVEWEMPTLEYVAQGRQFPKEANIITLDEPDTWTYWIIGTDPATPFGVSHPIHLHGHDFCVLGQGTGQFDETMVDQLNFDNPLRRDVAMLPPKGWLVIAFQTDNPGAWLMHCHIAWHVGEGLSVQFLERSKEIRRSDAQFYETCKQWDQYYKHPVYLKDDSGI